MKQTHFLLCIICFLTLSTNAQQDNNWYFGRMAGLNFSTGRPTAITNSSMNTMEGSSSISDMNGNILFYTDGITVWNRHNHKMPHGTGLLGDQSTTQSAVIVQKPGSQTRYYIFTADDAGGANGLTYSEVDMLADNGMGDIVSINNQLITPVAEKITAVYHANGKDIWITTHQWKTNAFYSYLITANGVNPEPSISTTGLIVEGSLNSGHYAGWMSISPNGKKLASANGMLAVELFDFNTQTGEVSNGLTLKSPAKCYGVEFSPNSKLLYVTTDGKLLQYQVNAPNIINSAVAIADINAASSIKLAPDSKIYVVTKYLSTKLSVVNNPNIVGTGCKFEADTIDLGVNETYVGLPNFLVTPYYLLDIDTENDCGDTIVSFSAIGTLESESITWDFGDGNQSTNPVAVHAYASAGTYTVKAKAKNAKTTRYLSKQITILTAPVAGKPANMATCGSLDGIGTFNLNQQDAAIIGSQPSNMLTVTYHVSQLDADTGANGLPLIYTTTINQQTIYARLARTNGLCYDTTSFVLTVAPAPVLTMDDSYSFCENSYVVVTAPKDFDSYTWTFNGQTETGDYQKSIDKPGIYILTVTKITGDIVCETSKTITVSESEKPVIKDIIVNEWTDNNNSIQVVTATAGDYQYSINNGVYQDEPIFENLEPGEYNITVKDKNGCGEDKGEALLLMYPKYFTPNGDGVHDKWKIDNAWFVKDMAVTIFDRYGKTITSFKGSSSGWDGTFNGNQLPATDYWFTITRKNGKEYRGHFSMLR